jgi:ABC-type uncharacterized transport system ATPase subunit
MGKSERQQRVSWRYAEPLAAATSLGEGLALEAGGQEFSFQVPSKELPETVKRLTQLATVQDLKIEEPDFEEVIRQFLETESRVLPSRDRH